MCRRHYHNNDITSINALRSVVAVAVAVGLALTMMTTYTESQRWR